MKNQYLVKQQFIIIKKDDVGKNTDTIEVNFVHNWQDNFLFIEIIDGKNRIKLWNEEAKALKSIMESTKFIFNQ